MSEFWTRHLETLSQLERELASVFQGIEERAFINQARVLQAFQDHRIGEHHLQGSYGYGHDDLGREALEAVFAQALGGEAALVRPHLASGTHAIASALFGCLRPGQELLFVTGHPYDTLEEVVGVRGEGNPGSLMDWGVKYREVDIRDFASPAEAPWEEWLRPETTVVQIQRSRGYNWRSSIPIAQIAEIVKAVKACRPDMIVFVDNCYGEFVEEREPCHVGADLIAGSLIKNPGGGLVPCGGYVCGREDLIEKVACRVFAPGMGRELGATLGFNRLAFQGFFLAPHVVSQSLKGAVLTAHALAKAGIQVSPAADEPRTDIIQALRFEERDKLVAFCRAIQQACPIDAYVTPEPAASPGYGDEVIMAAGTFAEGSTIELSADGPLRPPYVGYLQGGLAYAHNKLALASLLNHFGG
ncbi:MAG: aluminum resistance family protein [Comamonadaceae bacterium CG12_big_fil_rev_8_21_14_0_65_59_15]|uniref:Aluminum resistance family protein n=1 Tax=bacterium (Candidatus Blackallbacteria) CG17_big_fil_post_rev_8_21_14_2_50_48_46 TaxID=2014261 RepID=A0A2M7G1Z6_9BACT|nr:MAG: aluminum resistance family protein [bacterium (Candidatus Blackallbacteria) CG18_big_fil_WC_8_21_14_2_50_49_26]PIQ54332.1 MAG: aluminum resistance family protein [Comamonadaceae bacterium CG12_big_fil_rev_8_21_14_0_65_59_15]PIW15585.1 MAG: aluminum resistance family protein [bacterium (Candidatus Blackallbacteria) CG17_big_fil_post_rev_8_21_14_2_50_48_46]PIW49376.1 MAG: aluminum resistance family protein [bacterium (Candidatus Blackallbacteria) CG13_big_fil_rev_8_21_14_2_50_49_14]